MIGCYNIFSFDQQTFGEPKDSNFAPKFWDKQHRLNMWSLGLEVPMLTMVPLPEGEEGFKNFPNWC